MSSRGIYWDVTARMIMVILHRFWWSMMVWILEITANDWQWQLLLTVSARRTQMFIRPVTWGTDLGWKHPRHVLRSSLKWFVSLKSMTTATECLGKISTVAICWTGVECQIYTLIEAIMFSRLFLLSAKPFVYINVCLLSWVSATASIRAYWLVAPTKLMLPNR